MRGMYYSDVEWNRYRYLKAQVFYSLVLSMRLTGRLTTKGCQQIQETFQRFTLNSRRAGGTFTYQETCRQQIRSHLAAPSLRAKFELTALPQSHLAESLMLFVE
jgi:hypothetical protein